VFRLKSLPPTSLPATPANAATPTRQRVAELARVAAGSGAPDTERVAELATVAGSRHDALSESSQSGCASDECQPLSPAQEAARRQVLAKLKNHPSVKRAFCNRFEDGTLIVTLAIRGVGTCDLLIPAERFDSSKPEDYAALLECLTVAGQ
jgi:hypothetical protein